MSCRRASSAMREPYVTIEAQEGIQGALQWAAGMIRRGLPAGPVVLKLGRPKRSLEQNKRLWAMLTDLASQVVWYGHKLTPEEWKIVKTKFLKSRE